jgi:beta-galactosidase
MRRLSILPALFLPAALWAQSLPYWQDMNITSVNAETRRTEAVWFADRADALSKGFRESENYADLNGVWEFKYFDDYHEMERFFRSAQNDTSGIGWDKIRVPGNWEVQGYGVPIYVNIPYEFAPRDPQPPTLPDVFPAALYHRAFTVPEGWKGRTVYLNLAGIKSGTYVYVNGKEIGYSEDSKSLARFDVTQAVKDGDNDLTIKVYRYSTGSWLECQDFWRISGIERDVYLSSEKTPARFDFSVVSTLDPTLTRGVFQLKMRSEGKSDVFYELIDSNGETVADAIYDFRGELTTVTDTIPDVRTWTAGTPELYTLLLKVNGEYTRFHVGFRRIEIATVKDGERDVKALLINGQPVKFKGVNMHEHNPYTGHYQTRENILEDLKLMKMANINAIRTCHYPQPREFYELCDSLGFYVYDEANIESHGMGYRLDRTLGNNTAWQSKHIDRILNMYYRTASYPCVTILSLGNEAGNGANFYEAYRVLKALERDGQNRPVCYERAEREWNTDMLVPQYPGADWFARMGERESGRPVVPSEYAHAMGNSTGSLDLQWAQIYAHTHLQGGFIWDWVDQGLYDPEKGWTYGGDYGVDAPSDANFLCNGLVNPDRNPHPGYFEVKHVYQDIAITGVAPEEGRFSIQNRFYFKDLKNYVVHWRLERDGKPVKKGKCAFSTPARQSEEFVLKLPERKMRPEGEYRIFFETETARVLPLLPKGTIVAADEVLVKDTGEKKAFKSRRHADVKENETEIRLSSGRGRLVFDKALGIVRRCTYRGTDLFDPEFGLRPNFWRGPTDNDYGNNQPYRAHAWKEASQTFQASVSEEEGTLRVTYALPTGCSMAVDYTLLPGGSLKISATFQGAGKKPVDIPRIGFRFRVKDNDFQYFGRGPMENYCDRNSGTFKSVYAAKASDEFYPYVRPQETGHHTETEWLSTRQLTVVADSLFEFNALRHSVEDLDSEESGQPFQWNNFDTPPVHDEEEAANAHRRHQTHLCDVPDRDFTEICIDGAATGVGGYDSWGSMPEPSRTVWSTDDRTFAFTLVPVRARKTEKAILYAY